MHLYDVQVQHGMSICESNTTIPGTELVPPVSTPFGRTGVRSFDVSYLHVAVDVLRHAISWSSTLAASERRADPYFSIRFCCANRCSALEHIAPSTSNWYTVLGRRCCTSWYVSRV